LQKAVQSVGLYEGEKEEKEKENRELKREKDALLE